MDEEIVKFVNSILEEKTKLSKETLDLKQEIVDLKLEIIDLFSVTSKNVFSI